MRRFRGHCLFLLVMKALDLPADGHHEVRKQMIDFVEDGVLPNNERINESMHSDVQAFAAGMEREELETWHERMDCNEKHTECESWGGDTDE